MKLLSASLALLGLDVAMAAIIAPGNNASPTRPRTALGLQETRRIAQEISAATNDLKLLLVEEERQGQATEHGQKQIDELFYWHQEAKRQQTSMSSSAAASGPLTTELAYFTAGGGVYSVSSLAGGLNVVAGKTLTVGGPDALVGGEMVSAAPSGLFVNGAEVDFETVTISASASMAMSSSAMAGTSSMAAEGSASGSASAAASQSGNGAVVPSAGAGVGFVAAVGAVVGVLVL